ncbi:MULTISPECIES: roadblock/LC7 domain-containing protein [Actinomadura]|uniref:Roadblock/LC7 domain-containing protein n=1 Tax=Actinomadura bangladeshensis TaxID=453573 RepID=A0A4R4NT76_9ACTN|nr:roadblock/LC7 domain-containing protein [Actinomadura bangladeshensis]NEA27055.1 roadblock/LC7 domain-containing protein [Actinomadura bangladeshensis]TDC12184.1 roadblock/LC7 domain-containing protein [Actinomadura bangladeshensis]
MTQKTGSSSDLGWLLDDLVHRLPHTRNAVVLSADGLLMASSEGMTQDDGEHLAAVAAGIQSLAKGAGTRFGGGPVRQTIVEMASAFLLVTVAGKGACLAVLAEEDADVGLIAYEMAMLVTAMGHHLTSPARTESAGEGRPA